jgi:hypothetical protein
MLWLWGVLLAMLSSRDNKDDGRKRIVQLIREEAERQGVPAHVALAFADIESGLQPDAVGDLDWSTRRNGELYRKHVLRSERLQDNPARHDPSAWHSYGLFQLLAPYHVGPLEHPSVLLDPRTNAERGVRFLGQLLSRARGDVYAARLAYVGCGLDGSRCAAADVERIRARLHAALERWRA